jgi:alpha-L-fucosidase
MKSAALLLALPLTALSAFAAAPASSQPAFPLTPPLLPQRTAKSDQGIAQLPNEKLDWLLDAKLGMFIHWGLYSGPAKGEWYQENQGILPDVYRKYATPDSGDEQFDAATYDPKAWAQLAKDAGMKWMCLVTRHHDGFALFNVPHPNAFTSMQTLHRDLVAEYAAACRGAGLKVGFYFSPLNWRYPGYYDVTGTNCAPNKFGYKTDPAHLENARIMKEENYVSVKTLLTKYGKVDLIFWDGGWIAQRGSDADGAFFHEPGQFLDPNNRWPVAKEYVDLDQATGKPLGIMGMVRKYQPDCIVNPRYGWIGDIGDEEGSGETTGKIRSSTIVDKCLSLERGPWGYTTEAHTKPNGIMSGDELIRYLANCAVRNMVILINVAPDRHGAIPEKQQKSLRDLGTWLAKTGDAFYATRGGPWQPVDRQYGYTYKGKTIYVHLLKDYKGDSFTMPPLGTWRVVSASDVFTGQPVAFSGGEGQPIALSKLDRTSSSVDTIVAITFEHEVKDIWNK